LLYPNGTVQHAGVVICQDGLPRHIYQGFPGHHPAVNRSREFQAVTAACVLIRRDAFERVGGFDSAYRNCLEDVDLCLRLGELGYGIRYCHEAVLIHYESVTRGRRSPEIDAASRLFRSRWDGRASADDVDYYIRDGLLSLSYGDAYPVGIRVAPELAIIAGDRDSEVEVLLEAATRQVFELLTETVRLTVEQAEDRAPCPESDWAVGRSPREALECARAIECDIAALQQSMFENGGPPPSPDLTYRRLREQVRADIRSATSAGATVLVVSRGDPRFTELEGRRGQHYPQDPSGLYAGHHPANDAEAIEELERLRADGADYLVFPTTSAWWLEHYGGLAEHLRVSSEVVFDGRHCRIFSLSGQVSES
jgi:hypothetical protein